MTDRPAARPRQRATLKTLSPKITTADTIKAKIPEKKAEAFYLSREWRALVAEIKRERGIRCEACCMTLDADGNPVRLTADHIIERKDGGADLDKRNIQLLCPTCNARKTAAERAKRLSARF
jgi:5-methylcytosine-specific restriction enzyme A